MKDKIRQIIIEMTNGSLSRLADDVAQKISKLYDVATSDKAGNHSAVATRETRITKPTEIR